MLSGYRSFDGEGNDITPMCYEADALVLDDGCGHCALQDGCPGYYDGCFEAVNGSGSSQCEYIDAVSGDVYLNPVFGDLWIVDGESFIKINDGYTIGIDEPVGFVKVGHVDSVISKKR